MKNQLLVPANDHILVQMPKDPKTSKVYIPKTLKDSAQVGVVYSVSPDVDLKIMVDLFAEDRKMRQIRPGDTLRWEKYAEADGIFDYMGGKFCLVKAKQVMGVYPGKINGSVL